MKAYCPNCKLHTEHESSVNSYATTCTTCGRRQSQIDRLKTQSQTYTTPDGIQGQLVEDSPETATFFVSEGQYKGYYHYNKQTGMGGTQSLPE